MTSVDPQPEPPQDPTVPAVDGRIDPRADAPVEEATAAPTEEAPDRPWWSGPVPESDRELVAAATADLASRSEVSLGSLAGPLAWWSGVRGEYPAAPPAAPSLVVVDRSEGGQPDDADRVQAVAAALGVRVRRLVADPRQHPHADGITGTDIDAALGAGRDVVDELIDAGADLVLVGSATTAEGPATAALVAAALGRSVLDVTTWPQAGHDQEWMSATVALRDTLRRLAPHRHDGPDLLRATRDPVLATMAGVVLRAAHRRTPVLIAGLAPTAAALVADRMARGTRRWLRAGSSGPSPAQQHATKALGLTPMADLEVGGDDAAGALVALPLLQAAARLALAR